MSHYTARISKHRSQRGLEILELSVVVLPMCLIVGLFLLDFSRVSLGVWAVRQALQDSSRCLVATHGRCADAAADPAPARLFNWYSKKMFPSYPVHKYNWRGELSWIQNATYRAGVKVKYLESAGFDAAGKNVQVVKNYYPAVARKDLNLMTAPYVSVTGNALAPTFSYPGGVSEPSVVLSASVTPTLFSSIETNRTNQKTAPFSVALDVSSLRKEILSRACVNKSETLPSGELAPCNFRHGVPLTLMIYGTSVGTNLGIEGEVTLTANGLNRSDLGGRLFSGPQSETNFVPRGSFNRSGINEGDSVKYSELQIYENIKATRDTLTLHFSLEKTDLRPGTVRWTPTRIEVYGPKVEPYLLPFRCNNDFDPAATTWSADSQGVSHHLLNDKSACVTKLYKTIENTESFLLPHTPSRTEVLISQDNLATKSEISEVLKTVLPANELTPQTFPWYITLVISEPTATTPVLNHSTLCKKVTPAEHDTLNYGVTQLAGSDGLIRNSAEAERICAPELLPGVTATNRTWSEKEVDLGKAITVTQTTCDAPTLSTTTIANLTAGYKKVSAVSFNQTEEFTKTFTSTQDPAVVLAKLQGENASCDGLSVQKVSLDKTTVFLPPDSPFVAGAPNFFACGDKVAMLRAQLRDHVPASIWDDTISLKLFAPQKTAEVEYLSEKPAACMNEGSPEPLYNIEGPRQYIGRLVEGLVPFQCMSRLEEQDPLIKDDLCEKVYIGVAATNDSKVVFDRRLAEARKVYFETLQSFFPNARFDCVATNCSTLSNPKAEAFPLVYLQGQLKVPLTIMRLGMGPPFMTVSNNVRDVDELFYASVPEYVLPTTALISKERKAELAHLRHLQTLNPQETGW